MPITEALRTIDFDMTMAQWHFWRARGRAIHAQLNAWPDDEGDPQIGFMETDVLAEGAATAHNTALRSVQA